LFTFVKKRKTEGLKNVQFAWGTEIGGTSETKLFFFSSNQLDGQELLEPLNIVLSVFLVFALS